MQRLAILAAVSMIIGAPVAAEDRFNIGNGKIFNNDFFGDGSDRWRTGSYTFSHLRAPRAFDGTAMGFGQVLEYRLRGEIVAPSAGLGADADRPYVGALSIGAHTHFGFGAANVSLGADLVAIGPQTGLANFQTSFHDTFGLPEPRIENELSDEILLGGTAAVSRTFRFGNALTVRPFAEAQVGVEDLIRLGGDIVFGQIAQQDLMLRDVSTGQLYRGTTSDGAGFAFVVGADVAAVSGSAYLPEDQGYLASETRTRARAGLHYQTDRDMSFFYGLTYLGEEFEGQAEGQTVGSLTLNFNF